MNPKVTSFLFLFLISSCSSLTEIGGQAIKEYKFYRKAKEEAKAKKLVERVQGKLNQSPPQAISPTLIEEEDVDPVLEKKCSFSFLKLRQVCR